MLAQALVLAHLGQRALCGVNESSNMQTWKSGPAKCVRARVGRLPKRSL